MTTTSQRYLGHEPSTWTPNPQQPKRGSGTAALVAAALLVGIVSGGGAAILLFNDQASEPVVVTTTVPEVTTTTASALEPSATVDPAAVGATVIPSVVAVEVGASQNGDFVQTASGSGVVFDATHIITNHHVVEGASAVQVVLSDGRVYEAQVVGSDPLTDVAVLSVQAPDLAPISLGSTEELAIGAPSVAVGSPLGLDGGPSLSVGVISALGREVQTGPDVVLYGMIQTDAPITNGSSGGALVDSSGALIGITTAVGASQLGIEGIGFATPIEIVSRVVEDIIATGEASHALLGILGSTAHESIGNGGTAPIGVTVEEVTPGSAADGAGITAGQVITAIDGVAVRTMDELITALRHYGAGDTAQLAFSDTAPITLRLGAR